MISRILIIASGGIVYYSKNFLAKDLEDTIANHDIMSDFLTIVSNFGQEIKGGVITTLNFRDFNLICCYDEEFGCIFIIVTDVDDIEEEARTKLELMKSEFIKRYRQILENSSGDVSKFLDFDGFVENHIMIPPRMLLIGENGVGKSTIMDLFPGETVLKINEDLTEKIEKPIRISGLVNLNQFHLREIDFLELIDNPKLYRRYLDTVDIICIVTNSAASNLGRTKTYFSRLKPLVKKADFYIIANFQDSQQSAFEPVKIEESFGIKTYGYSAIQEDSKEKILSIFIEILKISIVEKNRAQFDEDISILSEKPTYRPSISHSPAAPSNSSLIPQDLQNLNQKLINLEKKLDHIRLKEVKAIRSGNDAVTKPDIHYYQKPDFICDTFLNILHISDIQEGRFGIKEDISVVHESYANYIADLKSKLEIIHRQNNVDILVISGDLASTGAKEEYENLTKEFVPILEKIFLKGRNVVPKNRWIVVPGNHDVEWGKGNARFNNFVQFCQENGFHQYKLNNPESIYSSIVCKDKNSRNAIGIIGLNSCLAILEEESRSRCNISNSYFSFFTEDWDEDFREIPKMMVCHHTLYAIKNDKFEHALNKLKDNNVLVALAGDIHKSESTADEISKIRCIPAGTITASKVERSVGIDEVSRQFNLINVNLQTGYIKWYTHLFEGTWRKVKNESFYLDHFSFSIK